MWWDLTATGQSTFVSVGRCGEVWCGGTRPQQVSLPLSVWAGEVWCGVVGPDHNR